MKLRKLTLLKLLEKKYPDRSRDGLYSLILSGEVRVNDSRVTDPRLLVSEDSIISFSIEKKYVSRGGIKLEHALSLWGIDVKGKTILDCGASTGGFTDCLLSRGAGKVIAVDVGYNQLAYKLRIDPRVEVRERLNLFDCTTELLGEAPDAAVCDLSFRSIRKAGAHILGLVKSGGFLMALVKPQFEWISPDPDFNGVVPDGMVFTIASELVSGLAREGVLSESVLVSPIRGRRGNMELFFKLALDPHPDEDVSLAKLKAALDKRPAN